GDVIFRGKAFEEQLAIVDVDLSPIDHQRLVDPRRRKAKLKSEGSVAVPEGRLETLPDAISGKVFPETTRGVAATPSAKSPGELEEIYSALVLGTRDY